MSNESQEIIEVKDLGLCSYGTALASQISAHEDVVMGGRARLLLVEHPPVLTLGKRANRSHILVDDATLEQLGVEVVATERGGEVTAHEPGQMVAYPILSVRDFGLTAKSYVCSLEQAVIDTLSEFGINAARDAENPGVWVGQEKVCAVGIRISQRATMHGIALNVTNDLKTFGLITPCGIQQRSVTTMSKLSGVQINVEEVKPVFVRCLIKNLSKRKT